MPGWLRQVLPGHHIDRGWHALALLLIVATALELAASVGLAYVAGFAELRTVVADFSWRWLLLALTPGNVSGGQPGQLPRHLRRRGCPGRAGRGGPIRLVGYTRARAAGLRQKLSPVRANDAVASGSP